MSLLELRDVAVARDGRCIVDGIRIQGDSGVIGLLGVNGAGKSTLLQSIAGLLSPSSGSVVVSGQPLWTGRRRSAVVGRIGLAPQEFGFPANFTVEELLRYVAFLRAVPRRDRLGAVERALVDVDLVDQRRTRVGALSGGMRRRVAIAQALLAGPPILLLDEATSGLDPVQRSNLCRLVADLSRDRLVVFASHIVEDVDAVGDRVAVIHEGRLAFDGTPAELAALAGPNAGSKAIESGFLTLIGLDER